jgi:uncharacterized membrane protein YvbJ
MTTLCPNCSRPARKDASFCGYCGNNLKSPGIIAQALPAIPSNKRSKTKKLGPRKDPGRTLAIIAIILLVLIIGGALIAQNWVEVLTFLLTSAYNLFAA